MDNRNKKMLQFFEHCFNSTAQQMQSQFTFAANPPAVSPEKQTTVRLRKAKPDDDVEMLDLSSTLPNVSKPDKIAGNYNKNTLKPTNSEMDMEIELSQIVDMILATEPGAAAVASQSLSRGKNLMQKYIDRYIQTISNNGDPQRQLRYLRSLRELCTRGYPILDILVDLNILPVLLECLKSDNVWLQMESCECLSNITHYKKNDLSKTVIYAGVIPQLIQLIKSPEAAVSERSGLVLKILLMKKPEIREYLLMNGIAEALKVALANRQCSHIQVMIVYYLCYCRKEQPPSANSVPELLEVLRMIITQNRPRILGIAVNAIRRLAHVPLYKRMVADTAGILEKLVCFLGETANEEVQINSIQAINNVLFDTVEQTPWQLREIRMNSLAILSYMPQLIAHQSKEVSTLAMDLLSKIIGCHNEQVQAVIDAELLPKIIEALRSGCSELREMTVEVISNFIEMGYREQNYLLVRAGLIPPFCNLLSSPDPNLIYSVLDALYRLLKKCDPNWMDLAILIEECGGLDKIEALQYHENVRIYLLSLNLVDRYFNADSPEEKAIAPRRDEQQFHFGSTVPAVNMSAFSFK